MSDTSNMLKLLLFFSKALSQGALITVVAIVSGTNSFVYGTKHWDSIT